MHVARKLDFVTDKRNKITEFFAELRRREVFGTAAYYFAISWGGIEILEWVLERWQVTPPAWLMPLVRPRSGSLFRSPVRSMSSHRVALRGIDSDPSASQEVIEISVTEFPVLFER